MALVLITGFLAITLSAQEKDNDQSSWKDKLVFGGDVVLNFGTRGTQVGLSPLIGYRVSERYITGLGFTYIYGDYGSFSSHLTGGRWFNRFLITEELFVHGEAEKSTYIQKRPLEQEALRFSYPAILIGAGYRSVLSENVGASVMVLYDVLQDPNSLYNGPIIRGGVTIGF